MRIHLALIGLLMLGLCWGQEDRGLQVVAVGGDDLSIGTYYLLAIGIDNYQAKDLRLRTAVKGATSLEELLTKRYCFDEAHCTVLLDAQASRAGIIGALRTLAETAGPDDSVLIYYAGHGKIDGLTKSGSWVPWDATFQTPATWIDNDLIKKTIASMKARHVLLISDSCFAGDFFRGAGDVVVPQIDDAHVREAFRKISRRAMTAGGLQPVRDSGLDGQSIYTWWLLKALDDIADPYVVPEQIHDRLKKAVAANSAQKPLYGFLREAGGEPDGSFVFFRRGTDGLDAAMRQKLERIEEMESLDKEAAEKVRRQQEEIARKQAQLGALDQRLAELQKKLGAGNAEEGEFEQMLAIAKERRRKGEELEALRRKAEEELGSRERALVEARRQQEDAKLQALAADLKEFREEVLANKYVNDPFRQQAWAALCRKWGVPETTKLGTELSFVDGKIHVGPAPVKIADLGMELLPIAAGTFKMGSNDGDDDEQPVHTVRISKPFWLGKTEVTQGQFEALMGRNPSSSKGKDKPVEQVSWNDAIAFCERLTARVQRANRLPEGYVYRLPTEAEWEYACRAGSTTTYCFGDNRSSLGDYAWYDSNSSSQTHEVGTKKPNAWGLYDMHGNVWEWCLDRAEWKSKAVVTNTFRDGMVDPLCAVGSQRIARGGSWISSASLVHSANRYSNSPVGSNGYLGFRVVLAPSPEAN